MLSKISTARITACLLVSLGATIVSAVIALILAINVPYMVGPDQAQPIPPGKTLTLEDLRKAETEAKERMNKQVQEFDRDSIAERAEEIKKRGLPISWLPWVVLPFVFRLRQPIELIPLFVVPIVLVLTPLVIAWELATYLTALLLGAFIATRLRPRAPQVNTGENQK